MVTSRRAALVLADYPIFYPVYHTISYFHALFRRSIIWDDDYSAAGSFIYGVYLFPTWVSVL